MAARRPRRSILVLIPLLLALLAGASLARGTAAHTWQLETVAAGLGPAGGFATLALDTAGRPHIAYRDGTTGRLKYAVHDGTAWNVQTLGYADTWNPCLALDAAGHPHIAYRDFPTLQYTYYDGAAWQTTTVDSSGDTGWDASLALDGAGYPHIAYVELGPRDLKYAYYDGTAWHLELVDAPGDQGRWASLRLDAAGRPHIAYLDYANEDLKYASRGDAGWQIEVAESAGRVGFDLSLTLDAAGRPHISHRDAANQDVRYTYYDGAAWVSAVADAGAAGEDIGHFTSLALDGAGRPAVTFYDWTNQTLRYAWYDGAAWQVEMVDASHPLSYFTSLALDAAGRPHIAYYDSSNGALRYAVGGAEPPPPTPCYWDSYVASNDSWITGAPEGTVLGTFAYQAQTYPGLVAVEYGLGRSVWALGNTFSVMENVTNPGGAKHTIFLNAVAWATQGKLPEQSHILVTWGHRELLTYHTGGQCCGSHVPQALTDAGYTVDIAFDVPLSLEGYDAVVMPGVGWIGSPGYPNPPWWSGSSGHALTTDEVATLVDFVQGGGALIASVEWNLGAPWMSPVANPMGVTLAAVSSASPLTVERVADHPIMGRPCVSPTPLPTILPTPPLPTSTPLPPPTATPTPPPPPPPPPPGTEPCWIAEIDQVGANLGGHVGAAGDVNGDGYPDLLVGAYNYDHGQVDEGGVFVYYGSPAGPGPTPDWTAEGDQAGAWFGRRAGTAGDVNGDGYDDIVVGAPLYDNGQYDEGRAYLYLGSAAGLSAVPSWTMEANQGGAYFGRAVGTAGDVNGDGYDDIIVGARYYHNGQSGEGGAFVYYGSPAGPSLAPDWTAESNQANAQMGEVVGTAGDVDGDGYSDVILGVYYYDNGQADEGRVYLYRGSAAGLGTEAAWTAEGDAAGAHLGVLAAAAGDVNGDGFDDVIVGVPYYDGGGLDDQGAALIYHGSAAGLPASPDWITVGDRPDAVYGVAGGAAGDVNADGYADVVVTAYWYDNGEVDEGKAYLYYGSAAGVATAPAWAEEGQQANAWYGCDARTAGDVNADGYADFLVGARNYDNGQTDEGRAYLYCGAGTEPPSPPTTTVAIDIKPGSCPNPVQRNDHGTLPVAILGSATLDVNTIDPAAVLLQGVAPLRYSYEDVSRPPLDPPDVCACTLRGPDGYLDLVLHWDVQAVLAALPVSTSVEEAALPGGAPSLGVQHAVFLPVAAKTPPGQQYVLTLTAASWSGAALSGQDCIIVLGPAVDAVAWPER